MERESLYVEQMRSRLTFKREIPASSVIKTFAPLKLSSISATDTNIIGT